jgi:hypothetical protein
VIGRGSRGDIRLRRAKLDSPSNDAYGGKGATEYNVEGVNKYQDSTENIKAMNFRMAKRDSGSLKGGECGLDIWRTESRTSNSGSENKKRSAKKNNIAKQKQGFIKLPQIRRLVELSFVVLEQ